jgi:hypothetical protein
MSCHLEGRSVPQGETAGKPEESPRDGEGDRFLSVDSVPELCLGHTLKGYAPGGEPHEEARLLGH